jgi:hypothetical protein
MYTIHWVSQLRHRATSVMRMVDEDSLDRGLVEWVACVCVRLWMMV